MSVVDVLSLGRARRYDTGVALARTGLLRVLFAGASPGPVLHALIGHLPDGWRRGRFEALTMRVPAGLASGRVRSIWWHLLGFELLTLRLPGYLQQRRRFSRVAGRLTAAKVVLAEQTEALEAFAIAHARGARTMLMMTGQAPTVRERWLAGEAARWAWKSPGRDALGDRAALLERERREIAAADVIISPSPRVTETLAEEPAARNHRVVAVDWPVWEEDFKGTAVRSRTPTEALHVLFAGSIGLQKGVLYLAEALEAMRGTATECRFVGGVALTSSLVERCALVGKVLGHVSGSEMAEHFAWAHVLVLPSLSEGRARVGLEALAAGVPVIATPNAGLPISEGFDGLIVPPRDSTAIRTALERIFNELGLLETLSTNAAAHAREFTLDRYAGQLTSVVEGCR